MLKNGCGKLKPGGADPDRAETASRIARALKNRKIDLLIVSGTADARYVSGFSGSFGAVVVSRAGNYVFTDARYFEQAVSECPGFTVRECGKHFPAALGRLMRNEGLAAAGYDPGAVTHAQYRKLLEGIAPGSLKPAGGLVTRLRAVKSGREIALIRRACRMADRAMEMLRGIIRPGVSEMDLEAELFYYLRKNESSGFAFPPVITSGPGTSLPHGRPSRRRIKKGDMVMVDFGAEAGGYRSDLTRTFCVGRMASEQKSVYDRVLHNQSASLEKIIPGLEGGRAFESSRAGLRECGWDLVHGLGHGVGLEVHELPHLSRGSGMKLRENMVFTVEPGVYLPGRFGVRIEDVAVLKSGGVEVLTKTSKRRIII